MYSEKRHVSPFLIGELNRLRKLFVWLAIVAFLSAIEGDAPQGYTKAEPVSGTLAIIALVSSIASVGLTLLSSLLRKPAPVETNRSDVRIATANYGDPIARVYGAGPAPARVIYRSEQIARTQREETVGSGKRKQKQLYNSYSCNLGLLVCQNLGDSVLGVTSIYANNTLLYAGGANGDDVALGSAAGGAQWFKARRLLIQMGKPDQLPCSWYEAEYGIGNVPAHRGFVTIWFEGFVLDDFFNTLPQFAITVQQADGTVREIITRECGLVGLDAEDLDLAALNQPVSGLLITQPQAPRGAIEALQQAYHFILPEVDGKLKGVKLPSESILDVPWGDLGAQAGGAEERLGSDPSPRLQTEIIQSVELPSRVEVNYFNPARRFEQSLQGYSRGTVNSEGKIVINSPLVLGADEANRIARVNAVSAWAEGIPFKFTLPAKYFQLHPGDAIRTVAPNGREYVIRLNKLQFGVADLLECEGVRQVAEAYQQTGRGADGRFGRPQAVIVDPPDTGTGIYNLPPLGGGDTGNRAYFAVAPMPNDAGEWAGAVIYQNLAGTDEGNPEAFYKSITQTTVAATMGRCLDVLAPGVELDTSHTFDVELWNGELFTLAPEVFEINQEENRAVVGRDANGQGEIVQFRDAQLLSVDVNGRRTYRLSYLRRGLLGTEAFNANHAADEPFVLINAALLRVPLSDDLLGVPVNFRAVTSGLDFEDVEPTAFRVLENE